MTNPDRPLVTFALFAYNQEKYIREAVEGAFSQTYQPLEIILSDDCSSDRTFEIMQEMAAAYKGPHEVRVRQSEVNFGTAQHVYAASMLAKSRLLIVAAGDDISEPNRCEEIVSHWRAEGSPVCCLHSAAISFDKQREKEDICEVRSESLHSLESCLEFIVKGRLPFISPTCAYSIELFQNYQPLIGGSIIEDGVCAFRSLACGKLISIKVPLVRIRKLPETAGTGYSIRDPMRWNRFVLSRIISYSTILRDLEKTKLGTEVSEKLGRNCQKKIQNLSKFLITDNSRKGLLWKIIFFLKYLSYYPTNAKFLVRAADANRMLGYADSPMYKYLVKSYKRRLS